MAKDIYKNEPEPKQKVTETNPVPAKEPYPTGNPPEKAGKTGEVNPAEHLEPYPTGNPPDPVEAHKEIHPHVYRELEEEPPPPEEDDPKSRAVKRGDETQSKKGK